MKYALIAGTGDLPPLLANRLVAQGHEPVMCEMEGFPAIAPIGVDLRRFRLETLGSLLASLQAEGVTHLCLAGAVQRPVVDPSRIDAATAPLMSELIAALKSGDDGTLRAIIKIIENQGFEVIGAHQIAPDLLPPAGTLCGEPAPLPHADLNAAKMALAEMARDDQGQALLVKNGAILAREDARGTDALLADFAIAKGRGATLFKAPKPGQELRADMPVIGPQTVRAAARAGLRGIAIELGGVMVLEREKVQKILQEHDMFLKVIS